MENCKAAQFNPKNACTDRCKWPGACVNGRLSVASVMETTEAYMASEAETPTEVEQTEAPTAEVVEIPKKKAGRPKKAT